MGEFRVFVQAEHMGKWFDFPISEGEIRRVLNISDEEPLDIDRFHETPFREVRNPSLTFLTVASLNRAIERFERLPKRLQTDIVDIMRLTGWTLDEYFENAETLEAYKDFSDIRSLGIEHIAEQVGGLQNLSDEERNLYFDYERYAKEQVIRGRKAEVAPSGTLYIYG